MVQIIISCLILNLILLTSSENSKLFKASKEWKTVPEDMVIPPGLHVRMNLQTGLKEAKLMDYENEAKNDVSIVPVEGFAAPGLNTPASLSGNYDEAIKVIDDGEKDASIRAERERQVRENYRDIETLKTELKDLFDSKIESDAEIMKALLKKYEVDDKVTVLSDLEYYLHQFDNAIDFRSMGGFRRLINDLNTTSIPLKTVIALCLGSAISSNPKMQIAAMEENLLELLIAILSNSLAEHNDKVELAGKIFYTIGAATRNFPYAQQLFVSQGGVMRSMAWLQLVLNELQNLSPINQKALNKLALKIVDFLAGMSYEKRTFLNRFHSSNQSELSEEDQKKKEQFHAVEIDEELQKAQWCGELTRLSRLFSTSSNIDAIDKISKAIEFSMPLCDFTDGSVQESLSGMKGTLIPMAEEEASEEGPMGDRTFRDLLDRIQNILHLSVQKSEL